MSTRLNRVEIDCPIHLTHKVFLYTFGHRYAGVWECHVIKVSDMCPHFDTKIEQAQDDKGRFNVKVCVLDSVQVKG